MGVVKVDVYGYGVFKIFKIILEVGVDRLVVVILLEGIELRLVGIKLLILILGVIDWFE